MSQLGELRHQGRLSKDDHQERHFELHRMFDELVADFILHNPGKLLSKTTLMELMEWSHGQTVDPSPLPSDDPDEGASP